MICYVLAMGKQRLRPHVVVGYGIKIFWPGLFITSPDHLVGNDFKLLIQGPVPERRNNSIPGINVPYFRDNFIPGINSVPEGRNTAIKGINLG